MGNKHQIGVENQIEKISDQGNPRDQQHMLVYIFRFQLDVMGDQKEQTQINHHRVISKAVEGNEMNRRVNRQRSQRVNQIGKPAHNTAGGQKDFAYTLPKAFGKSGQKACVHGNGAKIKGHIRVRITSMSGAEIEDDFDDFKCAQKKSEKADLYFHRFRLGVSENQQSDRNNYGGQS